MSPRLSFDQIAEAAVQLSLDDQLELIAILEHNVKKSLGKQQIIKDVEEARKQYDAGQCNPTTPSELMREIEVDTELEYDVDLHLTPEEIAELDRRVAEYHADPSTALSWEEVRKTLFEDNLDNS